MNAKKGPKRGLFIADHPFVFILMHTKPDSDINLFMGRTTDPNA